MGVMKLNGEVIKEGIVISKRKQPGIFSKKYLICVRFDEKFNKRTGQNKFEYRVNANRYHYVIVGARVQAAFEKSIEGYQPAGNFF